jgi:hypothetical protein
MGKKTLARLESGFVFLLANPEFYSHLASGYPHPCREDLCQEVRRWSWNWIGHVLRKDRTDDCAAGGRLKEEEKEVGQKPPGGKWWNWNETVQTGTRGTQHAVQLQTDTSERKMSVPPGTERIKVKVRN